MMPHGFRLVLALAALTACGSALESLPVFSVTVAGSPLTIGVGQTTQLVASVRDVNGVVVNSTVRWTSLAPTIASVDSVSGLVRGVAAGSATIRARSGTVDGTIVVSVQ